jgi:Kdo2-lipid IVA lauroyltransferase/acyltransferase
VFGIARGTFIQFGQTIVEFLQLPKRSARFLLQQIHFEPPDFLVQAQQAHYGAICLTGHFGNWELLGAAITDSGIPLSGIAKEQRNPFVDRLIADARAKRGIETFSMGIALRGILKALKEKKFVAILGDQDAHREGVFVQFLGRPSSTAQGPAVLALKTGTPLLFGADVRDSDGKHTIYLQKIDHSDLSGVSEENVRILTQRHASVLERYVRQWPDHWFWMHKRWKTKPDA